MRHASKGAWIRQLKHVDDAGALCSRHFRLRSRSYIEHRNHPLRLLYTIMRPFKNSHRRICWASQLPRRNDRLDDAVDRVREKYFSAQVLIAMPTGEMLAVEVCERGRRLAVKGKAGEAVVAPAVFWRLVEAARRADGA